MFGLALALSVFIANLTIGTNRIKAETGKGTDIFKGIMTVFGVEKADIVAVITVNNGEV